MAVRSSFASAARRHCGRARPRRLSLALLSGLLAAGALAPQPAQAAATDASFTRLAGPTRYETAVEIAREYVEVRVDAGSQLETALLTSGDDEHFGYALVTPALSLRYGAPLLLTEPDILPASVETFLHSYAFEQVIIIGDVDVVSDDVAQAVRALGLGVSRIGEADVYATAVNVAGRVGPSAGIPGTYRDRGRTSLLATGELFADALAAGPLAYQGEYPILLTPRRGLRADVAQFLTDSGTEHVVILGGPAAVSTAVEIAVTDLGITVDRLYGDDRFATATRIAEELLGPDTPRRCFEGDAFGLAYGFKAADALVSGPLLGEQCTPLLLTELDSLPDAVADLLESDEFAPGDDEGKLHLTVFGGPAAITSFMVLQAVAAGTLDAMTAEISGVQGRCYINVTFDEPVLTADAADSTNYRRAGVAFGTEDTAVVVGDAETTTEATILLEGAVQYPESVEPVGCSRPLRSNEEIEILGGRIGEKDGRRSVRRSVNNVVADRTGPTLSMTAYDTATSAVVTSSEPIRVRSGVAEVEREKPQPLKATVIVQVTDGATRFEVSAPASFGGTLRTGDRITIVTGAVEDLAGNGAGRVSARVVGDNTLPEVAKVTVSRPTGRTAASLSVDGRRDSQTVRNALTITGKLFGAASGAVGNGWTLQVATETSWLPTRTSGVTVTDTGAGGRIFLHAPADRTLEDVVADLNRNADFREWFVAELDDEVDSTPEMPVTLGGDLSPTAMRGGLSSVDIAVIWSEPVLGCDAGAGAIESGRFQLDANDDGNFDYSLDGRGAGLAGVAFVAAPGGNESIVARRAACDETAGAQSGTLVARLQASDIGLLPGQGSLLLISEGAATDFNGNRSVAQRFAEFSRP